MHAPVKAGAFLFLGIGVQAGSLVTTGEGRYCLVAAVGKVGLDGVNYFVLSMAAPLGRALLGRR